mgnify:FL=1|jgi:hypothetical protein
MTLFEFVQTHLTQSRLVPKPLVVTGGPAQQARAEALHAILVHDSGCIPPHIATYPREFIRRRDGPAPRAHAWGHVADATINERNARRAGRINATNKCQRNTAFRAASTRKSAIALFATSQDRRSSIYPASLRVGADLAVIRGDWRTAT